MPTPTEEDITNLQDQITSLEARTNDINTFLDCVNKAINCEDEELDCLREVWAVVDTIADLSAASVGRIADGTYVYVKGYWTENDGGGGLFYLDKNTGVEGLANLGTIIASPDPDSYWRRVVSKFTYTAEMFGAKVDDDTFDNTPRIQNCLDSHNYCQLTEGIYYCKSKILVDAGGTFLGLGNYKSILKQPDNNTLLQAVSPGSSDGFSMIQSKRFGSAMDNNITIKGIGIDLNGVNNRDLLVTATGRWNDLGLTVEHTALAGIQLQGSNNRIIECRVEGFRAGVSVLAVDGITNVAGRESFVLYASGRPNQETYGNKIIFCEVHDNAPQQYTGNGNREITLITVGSGDQTDSVDFTPIGRGNEAAFNIARNIHQLADSVDWTNAGDKYAGDFYKYDGDVYRCNNSHTSSAGTFADDSANFDLVGDALLLVQEAPINCFTGNGWDLSIHDNQTDNVDGAFFYFDTSELVHARIYSNRCYNISSALKININGGTQTDRVEDVLISDNEFKIGVYIQPRDHDSDGSVLNAIQINSNGQPGYGDARGIRLRSNIITTHSNPTYQERTRTGYIYAPSSTAMGYLDDLEISENVINKQSDTITWQYFANTSTKINCEDHRWWNNRDQNGEIVDPEWVGLDGTVGDVNAPKIGRLTNKGGDFHANRIVVTQPILLVSDHFCAIPDATQGGDAGWVQSVGDTGASAVGPYSAGHPGVLQLQTGIGTGANKYVSFSRPGKVRLDDYENWFFQARFKFGLSPATEGQHFVFGLVNNTDPTIVNSTTEPAAITRGVFVVMGLGNDVPPGPQYFSRLYKYDSTGNAKHSVLSANADPTGWKNVEVAIRNTNTSPRISFWVNDVLVIDDDIGSKLPTAEDLFLMFGYGQDSVVATPNDRVCDVDSILFQPY